MHRPHRSVRKPNVRVGPYTAGVMRKDLVDEVRTTRRVHRLKRGDPRDHAISGPVPTQDACTSFSLSGPTAKS